MSAATATPTPAVPLGGGRLRPPWTTTRVALTVIAAGFGAGVIWSFGRVGLSLSTLIDGLSDMRRLFGEMLPPDFAGIDRGQVLELTLDTFFIALLGTVLAVGVSFPVAFLAARNTSPHPAAFYAGRAVIVSARAIPDLVFALVFVRAFGIGVLPGVLAIGLHAVGMVGKLFADAVEQIDEGPREAIVATGASPLQVLSSGVLPQVTPSFIGTAMYRLDINFRTATILGFVGAGGIGLLLDLYKGSLRYDLMLAVTAFVVVTVIVVEWASAQVRRTVLGGETVGRPSLLQRIVGRRPGRAPQPLGPEPSGAATTEVAFDHEKLRPPWTTERVRLATFGAIGLVLVVIAQWWTDVSFLDVVTSSGEILSLLGRLVPTDLDWFTPDIREALVETLALGFAATFLGVLVALPLGFLAARNVAPARWVYAAARYLVVVVRAVPELIIAVVFVAAVGLGPFPGVMALAVGTVGFATKLFADAIEEVSPGPREGVTSTGATRVQESSTGVLTQAMPALVGHTLYMLDINIRSSVIVGIVGAGGVGYYLIQAQKQLRWDTIGGIMLVVFGVVFAIELISTWVRRRLI
ncbi:MAG: phosphonate ABC transporter, permease protein PhnE [Actinomycetota bacterium]|nr:phosphonate ABC transporter, permease protein PhnE [Actinomycetota bacterium]